jgi:hypothetical protein
MIGYKKFRYLVDQALLGVDKELLSRKPDGMSDNEYTRRMTYLHGKKEGLEMLSKNLEIEAKRSLQ